MSASISPRVQLNELMAMQQRLYNDSAAYTDLQNNLKLIVSNDLKSLKTKVNIGSDVYQEALITDCSKVFVDVGLGVNVEFKTKDAVVWIDNRLSEITNLIAKNEIEIERLSNDPNATAAI